MAVDIQDIISNLPPDAVKKLTSCKSADDVVVVIKSEGLEIAEGLAPELLAGLLGNDSKGGKSGKKGSKKNEEGALGEIVEDLLGSGKGGGLGEIVGDLLGGGSSGSSSHSSSKKGAKKDEGENVLGEIVGDLLGGLK